MPLPYIVTVETTDTITEALDIAIRHGFSRLPVLGGGDDDDIVGLAYMKDLIKAERDQANRRVVPAGEIDRLRGEPGTSTLSARNRFNGVVTDVAVEGLLARVELVVSEPVRLVAVVTRDAVEELGLEPGMAATAIVKSTNVMLQH